MDWKTHKKWIIPAVFVALVLFVIVGGGDGTFPEGVFGD